MKSLLCLFDAVFTPNRFMALYRPNSWGLQPGGNLKELLEIFKRTSSMWTRTSTIWTRTSYATTRTSYATTRTPYVKTRTSYTSKDMNNDEKWF